MTQKIWELSCNFCGKTKKEVKTLIASGRNGPYICNRCIALCNELVIRIQEIKITEEGAEFIRLIDPDWVQKDKGKQT